METRSVLYRVGAGAAAAGSVAAATVADTQPPTEQVDAASAQQLQADDVPLLISSHGTYGLASIDKSAGLCFQNGGWNGPKRVGTGIKASGDFFCPTPFGGRWQWDAQLQRRAAGEWRNRGDIASGYCTRIGDAPLNACNVSDRAAYRSGTYRLRVRLVNVTQSIGGSIETVYSSVKSIG
jgi:hypothetical protein